MRSLTSIMLLILLVAIYAASTNAQRRSSYDTYRYRQVQPRPPRPAPTYMTRDRTRYTSYGSAEKPQRNVIYRGPQSYPGYRQVKPQVAPRPNTAYRPADISKVKLYGPRRNEKQYREGLSELAGLMDAS